MRRSSFRSTGDARCSPSARPSAAPSGGARRAQTLEEALAVFERIGAALWAERARAELKRISGRAATPGALTPAEERVAALVAEGKTNREVAAALFLSDRTVEGHLSRIFGKLGIKHRSEVAPDARVASNPGTQTQGIARLKHGGLARFSGFPRSLASKQVVRRVTRSRRRGSNEPQVPQEPQDSEGLTRPRHRGRRALHRSSYGARGRPYGRHTGARRHRVLQPTRCRRLPSRVCAAAMSRRRRFQTLGASQAHEPQYGLGEFADHHGRARTPTPPSADSASCTAPACMAPDRGPG